MQKNSHVFLERHDSVEIDGQQYRIRNCHKLYVKAISIVRNKDIFDEDKLRVLVPLLFEDEVPEEMWMVAIEGYFNLFSEKNTSSDKATFDMIQDAPYIFAGFMQTYGIDLDEEEMTVEKFLALLKGLPSDTKLSDIIRIREMPIPKTTKYNASQVSDIMKAKANFALKSEDESLGMQKLGRMIKGWAEHGKRCSR